MNSAAPDLLSEKEYPDNDICQTTKKNFETLLLEKDVASHSNLYKLEYALPILTYYKRYNNRKLGTKFNERYSLFEEALELRNGVGQVLRYYWSLFIQGYDSTVATHFSNADMVVETCQCLCGERTFRNAVDELVKKGWLEKEHINTGTRQKSGADKNGKPTYSMLKVCHIKITPKSKLLFTNRKLSYNSIQRKKIPLALAEATLQPPPPTGGKAESEITRNTTKDTKTSLSSPLAKTTVEQKSINNQRSESQNHSLKKEIKSKLERKKNQTSCSSSPEIAPKPTDKSSSQQSMPLKAIKKRGKLYGRRVRNIGQVGYLALRKDILDIILELGESKRLQNIFKVHSHLNYPPLAPLFITNLDILIQNSAYFSRDKVKHELVKRVIIPALKQFEHCFDPPNPFILRGGLHAPGYKIEIEKKRRYDAIHEQFTNLSKTIKQKIDEDYDENEYLSEIKKHEFLLNHLPWLLTMGNQTLDNCTDEELQIFKEFNKIIGEEI